MLNIDSLSKEFIMHIRGMPKSTASRTSAFL